MPGVRGEKLLTASDLATLCEVDLKTIHNWVDRGRIPHFRTPGRHLRFRAADAAEFLRAWGYAVPRELAQASARAMVVASSPETFTRVSQAMGDAAILRHAPHPYDALVLAGAEPIGAFIVEARTQASAIDLTAMIEALHRASAEATIVVLSDEGIALPPYVKRFATSDLASVRALLAPAATAPAPAVEEPRRASGT